MVDEALNDTGRANSFEAFLVEDDRHLETHTQLCKRLAIISCLPTPDKQQGEHFLFCILFYFIVFHLTDTQLCTGSEDFIFNQHFHSTLQFHLLPLVGKLLQLQV